MFGGPARSGARVVRSVIARGSCAAVALSIACVLTVATTQGCELLVDTNANQCASDADCAAFGDRICVQAVCVAPIAIVDAGVEAGGDAGQPCTSNQDCIALNVSYSICRKSDHQCAAIVSDDCGDVIGVYKPDDTILLGAIIPQLGPYKNVGIAMRDAISVAVASLAAGVPAGSTGTPRPIGVVMCNESDNPGAAALHLVDDLEVPAIVGPFTTESAAAIATALADAALRPVDPQPIFSMSPTVGTAPSTLAAWPLFSRIIASDLVDADAMVAAVETDVAPFVASKGGGATVRLGLVYDTDIYGTTIAGRIRTTLRINDAPATASSNSGDYVDVAAGDPNGDVEARTSAIDTAIQSVTDPTALPDIIVVVGHTEAAARIIGGIEDALPSATMSRPIYVLSDAMQVTELLTRVGGNASFAERIVLATPSAALDDPNAQAFAIAYKGAISDASAPTIFGTPQTYDAVMTTMLAITEGTGPNSGATTDAVTPNGIAAGLQRILATTSGAPVPHSLAPMSITDAFQDALKGLPLDLAGASGPLDDVLRSYEGAVQLTCVVIDTETNAPTFQASGRAYDPTSGALAGGSAPACLSR